MANPHKGEVSFEVAGVAYTLSFSTNALCELEAHLDLGINEITALLGDVRKMRLRNVRAVFWAGLLDHHPGITVMKAGELAGHLKLPKVIELISNAFALAFPDDDAGGDKNPPVPGQGAGTGPASSKAGLN